MGMFLVQFLVLTAIVSGVLIFFLKKALFDSTQGAVNRLHRETEDVRTKQSELNEKIKQASEELNKRRAEADQLVSKMKEDAHNQAMEEREKIVKKSREDAEEILNKAQRTKEDMRKVLEAEVDLKAVDFAVIVLGEIMTERALEKFDDSLIDEFIKDIESVDMSMITADVMEIEITTARPLKEDFKKRINAILDKKLERPIEIKNVEDKEIIAGMNLMFGSLSLNASLQHLLKTKGVEVKEKLEKGILKLD